MDRRPAISRRKSPDLHPESVERELNEAVQHVSAARTLLEADWLKVDRSNDLDYVQAFARYSDRLVAKGKNVGECGVLAMGEIYKCVIVIDDSTPYAIAKEKTSE